MSEINQNHATRTHQCPHCSYLKLMLSAQIPAGQIDDLGNVSTRRNGPYHSGEFVYRNGDHTGSIYIVQSGAVKTQFVTFEGDLHVSGYYLAGEIFGLESTGETVHSSDAVALERTWICEIPMPRLESLCVNLPRFQHQVLGLYGQQLRHTRHLGINTRKTSAEERILDFLRDLYQRTSLRLGKVKEIRLPMRKTDIANFLSLTPEHLSRVLHEFEKAGLIRNHFRSIEYLDHSAFAVEKRLTTN